MRPYTVANPAMAQAMREKRRSGACMPYDSRPRRERTRAAAARAAILRSMEW